MRTFFIFSLITLLALASCSKKQESIQISVGGKIIGADGQPPARADVHIYKFGTNPFAPEKSVTALEDGSFNLQIPLQDSLMEMMVTAADHQVLQIPLVLNRAKKKITLTFHLEPYSYVTDFSQVKIIGDWNKFNFASAQAMQPMDNGKYFFEASLKADTIGYQLYNITTDGRSVNGTMYDALRYDGGGDYISLIKTTNGKAKIIFDPSQLLKPSSKAPQMRVKLDAQNELLIPYIEIALKSQEERKTFRKAYSTFLKVRRKGRRFHFEADDFKNYLLDKMHKSKDTQLQKFAAIYLVNLLQSGVTVPDSLLKEVAELIPLADAMWRINPMMETFVYKKAYGGQEAARKFENAIKDMPYNTQRAAMMIDLGLAAKKQGNLEKQRAIYRQLVKHFANNAELSYYIGLLNPNQRIATGQPVPDFKLKLMDSNQTVSKKSLLGKYYLMDFWATWCGPCVGEMPGIDAAYKKFRNRNFTILSLSFDRSKEDVEKFRRTKWKMPWLHVYLDKPTRKKISDEFEIRGIPKPLLVNPKGIIIATEADLRGGALDQTLDKYLK